MGYLLVLAFLLPTIGVFIPLIILEIKKAMFIRKNQDYVKMRMFSGNSILAYKIKIFSVNDQKPNVIGNVLYATPGNHKIVAQCKTIDKSKSDNLLIGRLFGLIGSLISFISYKKSIKMENPKNGTTIDIELKRKGYYEMKADPYEETFNITCFESEKPEIKTYK